MEIPDENKLRVIVADDHSIFRLGLVNILKAIPFVKEIKEAENGAEVLKMLKYKACDVVFLDIEMPIMNGIETLKELRTRSVFNKIKVIALSMHSSEEHIMDMYAKDVNAYLLKNTTYFEVKRTLELVTQNQQYFCPEVTSVIAKNLIKKDKDNSLQSSNTDLSESEKKILMLICEQFSNGEIAERLDISEYTVKRHRQNLMLKVGVKNTVGLVLYAMRKGFINI